MIKILICNVLHIRRCAPCKTLCSVRRKLHGVPWCIDIRASVTFQRQITTPLLWSAPCLLASYSTYRAYVPNRRPYAPVGPSKAFQGGYLEPEYPIPASLPAGVCASPPGARTFQHLSGSTSLLYNFNVSTAIALALPSDTVLHVAYSGPFPTRNIAPGQFSNYSACRN